MAKPRLTRVQREQVLEALADLGSNATPDTVSERVGAPISKYQMAYFRRRYGPDIQGLIKNGRNEALTAGLALKENRVKELAEYAGDLKSRSRSLPIGVGKEWRATLKQISEEVGDTKDSGVLTILVKRE